MNSATHNRDHAATGHHVAGEAQQDARRHALTLGRDRAGAPGRYRARVTDLDALTADVRRLIPILAAMGLEVVEAERGSVAARIPAEPNVNHFGVAYAGSLFSVAEMLGGLIARTTFPLDGFVPLVKHLEIGFLKPATTAVVARASLTDEEVARVISDAEAAGKGEYTLSADVTDEAGAVVARTTGRYQLRRL